MKRQIPKEATDLRRQHNQDILRRLRSGDALMSYDSKDSWYPPRPIIKKDEQQMKRVYTRDDGGGDDGGMGEAS